MIKLHKLLFLFAAVAAFTACSNSEETNGTDDSLLLMRLKPRCILALMS